LRMRNVRPGGGTSSQDSVLGFRPTRCGPPSCPRRVAVDGNRQIRHARQLATHSRAARESDAGAPTPARRHDEHGRARTSVKIARRSYKVAARTRQQGAQLCYRAEPTGTDGHGHDSR
jgi:hypothetical protein